MVSGKKPDIELNDDSESPVLVNDLSLCHGELVFHDFQSQHVTWIAPSQTYHVNDVDVSYYLDVCLSHMAHRNVDRHQLFL